MDSVHKSLEICDRCGRVIDAENQFDEWQERFLLRFKAGYGSVFGDGDLIEACFCQYCIHELLGPYCRHSAPPPHIMVDPIPAVQDGAKGIYQPYQAKQLEALLQRSLSGKGDDRNEDSVAA